MQGLWGRKVKGKWYNYIILSKNKRSNHKRKELQDPGLNPKIFLDQHLVLKDNRAKKHGACIRSAVDRDWKHRSVEVLESNKCLSQDAIVSSPD